MHSEVRLLEGEWIMYGGIIADFLLGGVWKGLQMLAGGSALNTVSQA